MRSATNTMNRVYKDARYDNLSALLTLKVPSGILGAVKPKGYIFYDTLVSSLYISDGIHWVPVGGSQPNASYIVTTNSGLSSQRILTSTSDVTVTDGGPGGNVTLNLSNSGVTAGNYYEPVLSLARGRITSAGGSRRVGFCAAKINPGQNITQNMTPVIITNWNVEGIGVAYNTDNCFDTTTGIFTAPVDGYYRVDIFIRLSVTPSSTPVDITPETRLQLSTGEIISSTGNAYGVNGTMDIIGRISDVIYMETGTQANCAAIVDTSLGSYSINSTPFSMFSIQLIFRD